MERKWYYAVDGVRQGPVTFEELRILVSSGTVRPIDLVWQPDFGPEWRNVGQVNELFAPQPTAVPRLAEEAAPLLGVTGARPSSLAAVAAAFERMVAVLFRPFDIGRWLSMGFCAWLAYLGTQSVNLRGSGPWEWPAQSAPAKDQVDAFLDQAGTLFSHPRANYAMLAFGLLSLLVALWLCALRSRGDFLFLHRWYRPDAAILSSWRASRAAGHALFTWRVLFFVVAVALYAAVGGFGYARVLRPYLAAGKVWDAALLAPLVASLTAVALLTLGVETVGFLTKSFVVPVMYWQGVSAGRAWLAVFALCNQYPIALLGYVLVGLACGIAAALAVLAFLLATCCVGVIPLALPYFNGVVLLPVYLFFRGYAVCFLSQWRPDLVPEQA